MERKTIGTVVSVKKQWWLKINTKCFRTHPLDGAIFPHVVKIRYEWEGKTYERSKWIKAKDICPKVGESVAVYLDENKPKKIRLAD